MTTPWPAPDAPRAAVEDFMRARTPEPELVNCPNCGKPHSGLYVTPPLGPDGEGVMHCGCFYEGAAKGKKYHCDRLEPWQVRCMNGEPPELLPCQGRGEPVCSAAPAGATP